MEALLVIIIQGEIVHIQKGIIIRIRRDLLLPVPHAFIHHIIHILVVMGIVPVAIQVRDQLVIILEVKQPHVIVSRQRLVKSGKSADLRRQTAIRAGRQPGGECLLTEAAAPIQ